MKKKTKILKRIYQLNEKRKLIEKKCLNEFDYKNIDKIKGVLFLYKPNIPEGIIGIIASKFKDYFNKPCIVFTNSNGILKGSARSTSNFNIGEYIQIALNEKIILSGGGHNLAAGVSLNKSNMDIFKKYINDQYKKKNYSLKNFYVSKISTSSINRNFFDGLKILGPFGNKNPNPFFLIEKVKIIKTKIINEKLIS